MRHTRWLASLLAIGLVLVGAVGPAAGHETTTVDGYELTFGGGDEPVITAERMWLQVEIRDAETGEPVEGLDDAFGLAVQRPFGDDTFDLEVSGVHGRPGWYEGAVVFTAPGTYTIYVTAEVRGETIETSFQNQVHDASALQYPPPTPEPTTGSGMDPAVGFGLGAAVAAIGLVGAFVIGRRTQR